MTPAWCSQIWPNCYEDVLSFATGSYFPLNQTFGPSRSVLSMVFTVSSGHSCSQSLPLENLSMELNAGDEHGGFNVAGMCSTTEL